MSDKLPIVDDSFPKLVPNLKTFIQTLGKCLDENLPLEKAWSDLRAYDTIMSAFALGFRHSIHGYDYNLEEAKIIAQIFADFNGVGGVTSSIFCDLKSDDRRGAIRDVKALVGQIKLIEDNVTKLKQLGEEKPKLSEVTTIDSILKAGRAIIEERRPWDMLECALEPLRPSFDKMVVCTTLSPELENYCEALDALFRVCEEHNVSALESALAGLKETGEHLVAQVAPTMKEKSQWLCPMCGAKVQAWDKTCPSCHVRLPERAMASASVSDELVDSNLPLSLQQLIKAVELLREGTDAWQSYNAAIEELHKEARIVQSKYLALPESVFDVSGGCDTVVLSRESIESGLGKLGSALEVLTSPDISLEVGQDLDNALENLVAGFEETRQVESAYAQYCLQ